MYLSSLVTIAQLCSLTFGCIWDGEGDAAWPCQSLPLLIQLCIFSRVFRPLLCVFQWLKPFSSPTFKVVTSDAKRSSLPNSLLLSNKLWWRGLHLELSGSRSGRLAGWQGLTWCGMHVNWLAAGGWGIVEGGGLGGGTMSLLMQGLD